MADSSTFYLNICLETLWKTSSNRDQKVTSTEREVEVLSA